MNTQNLLYTFTRGVPISITEYANPYFNNARAAMMSFFAQDQWTLKRLTLQGAVRYDHPWSWFPAVDQPKSTFFPGVHFDTGGRRDRLQRHHAAHGRRV